MKKKQLTYLDTYLITHHVINALRKSVMGLGFNEILPSIISKNYEPGAKHSIAILGDKSLPEITQHINQVSAVGQSMFYLPVSHVVEKQMSLEFLDKAFCVAPCLRLVMDGEEKSGKHIFNFFQFEIEWRTESMSEVFSIGNEILNKAAQILSETEDVIKIIKKNDQNLINLKSLTKDFPAISFKDAKNKIGEINEFHKDFTQEEDEILSHKFKTPFWIYDYPAGVRDSIYHENAKGTFDTYDLMLPFGFGELTTGGIRPKNKDEIIKQSSLLGKTYSSSYAEWKNKSLIQTAGFGIGIERFMRFITNTDSILDFVQYHDHGPNKTINSSFFGE